MATTKLIRFVTLLTKVECVLQDPVQIIKFMEGAPRYAEQTADGVPLVFVKISVTFQVHTTSQL